MKKQNSLIVDILKNGGIGVMPTDTIYGLVGSALNKKMVERIYKIRKRNPKKPLIILIGHLNDLALFNVRLDAEVRSVLNKYWPGEVSIILPCKSKKFSYLHRGTDSLAFRLPSKKHLVNLLKKTGPLVAPSANWEGFPPATNIKEAKQYFGSQADFYDGLGTIKGEPSALISVVNGKIEIIREGSALRKALF